jgi:hypothetical protein
VAPRKTHPTGRPGSAAPPLFILAPPRSFTSVTCAMVGEHPEMLGLAELNLFVVETIGDLRKLHRVRARLQHGLLRSLAELAFSEQAEDAVEAARAWLADNEALTTVELFRTMQEWADGRSLIDKSPLHVYSRDALARMGAHFPDAYFLHLTRHPGETLRSLFQLRVESREKARQRAPALVARFDAAPVDESSPEKLWLEPHLNVLEFLKEVAAERQMRLRGEDLMSEPAKHLAHIAEWLQKRSDSEAIDAMMHPETSPFAAYGPPNARYGNDPSFMEKPRLRPYSFEPRPLQWQTPDGRTLELGDSVKTVARMLGY